MFTKSRAWVVKRVDQMRDAGLRAVSSVHVRRLRSEKGQTMVEYGLILALIAVVVVVVLTTMGTQINAEFTKISGSL